jgi:acyl-CoA reductase-like NAD-dependent aldehyde dehydrogenase
MAVYTDEIFGPVLSVLRVASYDEALEMVNRNPYGNGTAIFTNDGGAARRFQNEVEVAWSASTCRCRADGVLLLRRLEELAVR